MLKKILTTSDHSRGHNYHHNNPKRFKGPEGGPYKSP